MSPTQLLKSLPDSRRRILASLRRRPAGIAALARTLDRSPMTIRHHLQRLEADGLVAIDGEERSGGAGRPAFRYRLTEEAEELFPKAYDRFARLLLDELSAYTSDDSETLPQRLARRAAAPHIQALEELGSGERALAAWEILRDESGFAELRDAEGAPQVFEYNCVYRRLVQDGGGPDDLVCRFHTNYVSELMGTPVALTSCQGTGAEACCFRPTADVAAGAPSARLPSEVPLAAAAAPATPVH